MAAWDSNPYHHSPGALLAQLKTRIAAAIKGARCGFAATETAARRAFAFEHINTRWTVGAGIAVMKRCHDPAIKSPGPKPGLFLCDA